MPRVDVETESFEAASVVFGQRIASQISSAVDSLLAGLSGSAAMAGSDEGGTSWAASYDEGAVLTVHGLEDLGNACYQLAGLLQQTGFNHGSAESASTAGGGSASVDRSSYTGMSMPCYASPPSASGGSSSPPTGWGMVQHLVGYAWPNGHQDKLRAAASAWNQAASTLSGTAYYTAEADSAIVGQRSPEVGDAVRVCNAMRQHITDIAASCRQLGDGCESLAGHIDTAHSQVEGELVSLVEWTVGIEAGGFLLGMVTFGGGEVAAQAAEAGRIAATARRIATVLEALVGAARTVAESVAAVLSRVGAVVERIKPLLGARASAVVLDEVGALPAIVRGAEEIAADGLKVAAEESAAEDAMYARYVAKKQAKGLTPRSRTAWEARVKSLSRNKLVGDGYRDTFAADLGIQDGVDGWKFEQTASQFGRRFDIANLDEQIAYEVKSGTSPLSDTLEQLGKDAEALDAGWTITWQLKQPLSDTLMARLQQLAEEYPGRFNYVVGG